MRAEYLQDALIYAREGMISFILGFAAFLGVAVVPILLIGWKPIMTSSILIAFAPLVLAVLTYEKMMRPLKANVAPSKKWASTLEILGYFFGLIAGGYLFWIANNKIKKAQDQNKTSTQ